MRFDMAGLRGVRMHPAGFLLVDARPTRAGIFKYRRPDGTVRAEYRPPDEVSRTDSLTTLRGASVTDLHPAAGKVSPDNVHQLEVGTVTDVRMDGAFVVAELVVKRADAIEAVRQKKRVELSCGYQCDFEATPGVTPSGERYDGVQRNIRYNHVALLPSGTARGGPECAMRLDANDAVLDDGLVDATDSPDGTRADAGVPMSKIVLNGVSYEAPEQTAQAVHVVFGEQKSRLDSLTSDLERQKAKADALQADLDKEKQLRTDALDPQKIAAAVQARVALERSALKVLGDEFKCDGLSDREIQEKVVLHVHKDAKLDGRSPDYVAARFDSVVETFKPDDKGDLDDKRKKVDPPKGERADAGDKHDDKGEPGAIRTDSDFRKRLATGWREDLSAKA
jgi:uncharacterized protein